MSLARRHLAALFVTKPVLLGPVPAVGSVLGAPFIGGKSSNRSS
jgi:hypothetical protein